MSCAEGEQLLISLTGTTANVVHWVAVFLVAANVSCDLPYATRSVVSTDLAKVQATCWEAPRGASVAAR